MKRREFIKSVSLGSAAAATPFAIIGCGKKSAPAIQMTHSSNDYNATIRFAALEKPLTVMHIADSHITKLDDSEKEFHAYGKRMDNAFHNVEHYQTGKTASSTDHFLELLSTIDKDIIDLLVLTGDIVNNPSKSSVNYVCSLLKDTGVPYLYIAGNHDWHYEGMQGSANELRKTWTQNSLLPFFDGLDPMNYAKQINGINFIGIDNSTYQVNAEQLVFFKNELDRGLPAVLMVHIPIYTQDHRGASCGNPHWGWETDRGYEIEQRERWPKSGNLQSTLDFVKLVENSPCPLTVLGGHNHRPITEVLSPSTVQYTTDAAKGGAARVIKFLPMNQI